MTLQEIIKSELVKNSSEIQINYICRTTSCNDEYIDIKIGDTICYKTNGDNTKAFVSEIETAINHLKTEFPNLHLISKSHEFHFYYSGFNSCSTRTVPVSISNLDPSTENKKTGIVTEKYQMVGTSKVMEVINAHPGYELYKRSGFGFRGTQERKTDIEGIKALCNWACCMDIEVIDNEIHVNGFSANDMW